MSKKQPIYQVNVIDEKIDLDGKIKKLEQFMLSVKFELLTDELKSLFHLQCYAMKIYSTVLGSRIERF